MSNFNQNNSGKRTDGDRFRGKRSEMFPATCDECGKSCKVPFRPTSGKPVYCSNCFESKGGKSSERFERRSFGRRNFDNRYAGRSAMHQAICDECGKNCEVPFRPTEGKPVFCSDCFENKGKGKSHFGGSSGGENYEKLKEQFGILNAKLDRILSSLTSEVISKSAPKEIKPKKATKKTAAKTKKSETKNVVQSN